MPTLLLLPLISFFMTACGETVIIKHIKIDQELVQSVPLPKAPPRPVTNRQDALYKNDLLHAARTANARIEAIKIINDGVK